MSSVNLQAMVQHVFKEPPKAPKSYLLDLQIKKEDYPNKTEPEIREMENANVAQILMSIFAYGCGVLYSSVTANSMTKEQFDEVNKYIMSFGYSAKYDYTYETGKNGPTNLNVWFERLD